MRLRPWTSLLAVLLISFLVAWMASQVVTPKEETQTFLVTFPTSETVVKTEIVFQGPGERAFTLTVPVHNVTNVDVKMKTPRGPEGREGTGKIDASVGVEAPDGAKNEGSGTIYQCSSSDLFGNCQTLTFHIVSAITDWRHGRVADETTIEASDHQDAEQEVARVFDETSWTGTWNGRLTIESGMEFDSLTVEVTLLITHYEAVVEPPRNASA
ncbi:MAG: hypothetical protein KY455_03620 [Euryarchaeota archaeon]|nr:hypothetical protein [Euryarchaeota archaeon]